MTARRAALLAMPALILLAGGCAGAAPAPSAVVEIRDLRFAPDTVTVPAGGTVEWRFDDGGLYHHVQADDGSFESEIVGDGTFTVSFDRPGTHAYTCSIHPYMTGTVVVPN
jgi:plastocyanin